jgi:hypothetical protein
VKLELALVHIRAGGAVAVVASLTTALEAAWNIVAAGVLVAVV